ncbi:MAG: ABC transporter substrate-binding protein [Nitrospinae bacterium]|nr:ABC transporter substrate-binding protein [Nitrospinota bacterium]
MCRGILVVIAAIALTFMVVGGEAAAAKPILPGSLAKLDIQDASIEPTRGVPKGTLTIAQHFALDPTWLDPQDHIVALTQQHYDYLVHDALLKTMPQGLFTYSLAEYAEATVDFSTVAFRLRQGLKFHDGHPLTTVDVAWSYRNYRGVSAKLFKDKLDSRRADGGIELVDERTIIFHFKEPFLGFLDLYNGASTGIGWIVPKHYYERVGPDGFKERPLGAGPFKFVSQQAGVQMVFEAWEEYWRRAPGVKTIIVKGVRDPTARLAGLQTGELDLAYGMTGRVLKGVMKDPNLRWDPNFTGPWWLMFPGYQESESPFHDKRVRQAVSLALNRRFLSQQETEGAGPPAGNWIGPEYSSALRTPEDLPVPEYNPTKAKQLLAAAGYANGLQIEWLVPFPPYFDMGERLLTDLGSVGIRGKLQILEGPVFRSKTGQGRKGYEGNRTIVQNIGPRPGGAKDSIGVYAICGGPSSFICEPAIEELWKRHEASTNTEERDRLIKGIQRIIIEEYYFVPIYNNPFVHTVGPRVLPEGEGFHRYWDTPQAPYPYPWEWWQVKE